MTTWPASLPRPVFDGYALDPLEQAIRTDMETGSPRNRRRSKARNDRISVSWRLTDREMMIFRAWFDYDGGAAGGSAWFDILLAYGDLGLKTRECRFSGIYKATPQAGMIWTVSASLEVRGGELTADQMLGAVLGLVSADGIYPTLTLNFAADLALDSRIAFARSSSATYFDAAGIMQTAALNVARFDHNPLTLDSLGLLLEEARTNLIANTDLTASASVVSVGTATGPDGLPAFKVVPNAGAVAFPSRGNISVQQVAISTTAGQTTDVAFTGWFAPFGPLAYKAHIVVMADISGASQLYALVSFDPTTGAFSSKALNTGWSDLVAPAAVLMPCGMWRVSWTLRYTQQASLRTAIKTFFQLRDQTDASSFTADGASGIQYACMQLEAGAFPTSYIPTTTAPATRSAETATISGAAFSAWHNASAGTLLVEQTWDYVGATNAGASVTLSDNTLNNYIGISRSGAGATPQGLIVTGGVSQCSPYANNATAGVPFKFAFAFGADAAIALDGAQTANSTDPAVTLPVVDRLHLGAATGTVTRKHIGRLVYWPARLPDAELRSITLA